MHVAVIMSSELWIPNESQFRFYGCTPWTEDIEPKVDAGYLHAMVKLALATGARLQGELFTVIRMMMEAHNERLGSIINTGDYGPLLMVTDNHINTRIKFERYLDTLPREDLVAARKVGLTMSRAIRRATNSPI